MNSMLTLEEVKNFLEIESEILERYLNEGKLHAYKIGGTYLRFRKEEVMNLKLEVKPRNTRLAPGASFLGVIRDFWKFNNFYIISILFVLLLIAFFLKF